MRDVPTIMEAWTSGAYVGDRKPATRVTVEKGWLLRTSEAVLGTWTRGPARWYTAENHTVDTETEVPNVVSVNLSRSLDSDAGSCDIVVRNQGPISLTRENPPGQWGDPGYFTWDHGMAQDAKARWNQALNNWNEVLVPNALIRTYQGFGGHDKTIPEAIRDENIVLNGVWLVDDVTVTTDGSLNIKCRDMAKLLIDQQLFPPLVPSHLYPLDYRRWIIKTVALPTDPTAGQQGEQCFPCQYLGSSTDEVYGQFNTAATGHPPSDAFDISFETGDPNSVDTYAHQKTYWLSEPKGAPSDSVWIEFGVAAGEAGDINQIYYHAWKGVMEGRGVHQVMVSVFENGQWAPPENELGGMTPDGLPFVCTFTPGTELAPATSTQLNDLPRDYRATKIRLTVTQLIWADDFPYGYGDPDNHGGGYRAGARKIMACFSNTGTSDTRIPPLVFAAAGIPKNSSHRLGYWQVQTNGLVYAFGDARTYEANSPNSRPASSVVGMAAHPGGVGYWYVDITGRVVSAGAAQHYGDLSGAGLTDVVDIAPTHTGDGYILLRNNGQVYTYGDGVHLGDSSRFATLPSGVPVTAKSIETHPSVEGYWVLWTDGFVDPKGLDHHGNANRTGFNPVEYVTALHRTATGDGYWIVSGAGRMQAFGDATNFGNADGTGYENENWYKGIVWDFIPSPAGDGAYAHQTADGKLWVRRQPGFADGLSFGSIGSGQATIRSDGNYKDYCLDADTEILTRRGWLRHDEVSVGDDAWALDPVTGVGRWSAVEKVHQFEHDGDVLRIEGRFLDAVATPNHRWITSVRWQDGHRFVTSRDLRQTHDIPLRPNTVDAPEETVDDEFVDLIAWFWTEGCIDRNRLCIAQSEVANPGHVDRIDKTLRHLYGGPGPLRQGHLWNRAVRSNGVVAFRLSTTLTSSILEVAPAKLPTIEWLTSLSADQRKQFVLTSLDADGYRRKSAGLDADGHQRESSWVLTQSNEERARRFEIACLLAGYGVSSRQFVPGVWSVTVLRRSKAKPVTTRRLSAEQTRWERHTGVMWCPTTATGTWLARRNGRCYFTGNSDIIRDLLLWSGFYLYTNPAPPGERPAVYGSIETTGAWAEAPLPRAMFDKKPISEAIKQIRDIVGATGFVDAEGGYRFEQPNWWAPGNYLPESFEGQRVPYNHMPEIDETVQLLEHSVTRSAKDARSRLIISTADPYPSAAGLTVPKEVVTTEITPMTAADLRGLVVPAMWINGHFLNKFEQAIMADLVDLRMWFGRRMASVSCVANPLIDINDQVRVIERTTGEVFIHYVRGINVSHDLVSGDFRMNLTTNWLGGSPYGRRIYYMAAAMHPTGNGYWQVAINGDVYAYGEAELYESHQTDSHLGWITGMVSTPSGLGYYTVDQTGKVLTYGDAEHRGDAHPTTFPEAIPASVPINDMAITNTGGGYYLLEQNGVVHCFGDAVFYGQTTNGGRRIPSGSPAYAAAIETHPVTGGYWVLWSDGHVDAFNLPHYGNATRNDNEPDEVFTAIRRTSDGTGYFVIAAGGDNVQAFNTAVYLGASVQYPDAQWSEGLVWDILVHPDGGYALQRANGTLEPFDFTLLGGSSTAPSEIMWAIVSPEAHAGLADPTIAYGVSAEIMAFLADTNSPSANNAVVNNFAAPDEDVIRGSA